MTDDDSLVAPLAPQRVDDPRTLRALSHPLRLRLLAELASTSPQNVSMLAEAVDEPANSVSYHLSQLVAHGLARRVEGPSGATRRERWFEAASRTGYAIEIRDDAPGGTATVAAVRAWALQQAADSFDRSVANEPEARRRGLPFGNAVINAHLTDAEARELQAELSRLTTRLAELSRQQRDATPDELRDRVHYTLDVAYFPDFQRSTRSASVWNDSFHETREG